MFLGVICEKCSNSHTLRLVTYSLFAIPPFLFVD